MVPPIAAVDDHRYYLSGHQDGYLHAEHRDKGRVESRRRRPPGGARGTVDGDVVGKRQGNRREHQAPYAVTEPFKLSSPSGGKYRRWSVAEAECRRQRRVAHRRVGSRAPPRMLPTAAAAAAQPPAPAMSPTRAITAAGATAASGAWSRHLATPSAPTAASNPPAPHSSESRSRKICKEVMDPAVSQPPKGKTRSTGCTVLTNLEDKTLSDSTAYQFLR